MFISVSYVGLNGDHNAAWILPIVMIVNGIVVVCSVRPVISDELSYEYISDDATPKENDDAEFRVMRQLTNCV